MATDREESIRSAARAYADSMGHGDACDLTLYGACDMTLYGEEYRCDCGYAALRSALAQPAAPHVKTEIVCLCGSTRFIDTFTEQYGRLTDEGKIVLSVGRVVPQSEQALGSARKVALDELHLRKIDLCDRVLVLNVGGYVGTSTRREIAYAKERGKPIDLLYPDAGLDGSAPAPSREAPEAGSAGAMREACAIETDRLYAHPTPPRAEGVERADRVVALEDSIRRWHHEKYGRAALIAPTVRKLGEEFGEFCEAAVKGDVPAMTEEAADVALILTNLVRAVGGGSLFDAMETKHEVCKQRLAAERGEG